MAHDPAIDHETGPTTAGGDAPIVEVFWRPGCGYCMKLDHDVRRWGLDVVAHNIWDDPDAAAFVRSVADGTETVPTVRIGEHVGVNPGIGWVIDRLGEHAPEPPPGIVDRVRGLLGRGRAED